MTDDLLTLPQDIEILRLHAEKLDVDKRVRETGRVTISTVTHTRDQLVDELLSNERVEIEHLVVDRMVEEMPAVREEGDTIIIPIVEEIVVVERRLMLRKEVRITRVRSTRHHQEVVQLRSQEAVVSRTAADVPTDHVQVQPEEDHDAQ